MLYNTSDHMLQKHENASPRRRRHVAQPTIPAVSGMQGTLACKRGPKLELKRLTCASRGAHAHAPMTADPAHTDPLGRVPAAWRKDTGSRVQGLRCGRQRRRVFPLTACVRTSLRQGAWFGLRPDHGKTGAPASHHAENDGFEIVGLAMRFSGPQKVNALSKGLEKSKELRTWRPAATKDGSLPGSWCERREPIVACTTT